MKNKIFFVLLLTILLSPIFVRADAPPPPPFKVLFTYSSKPFTDISVSTVRLVNNSLKEPSSCSGNACFFNNFLLGKFQISLNIPTENKTYLSNSMNREYLGYYGKNTITTYHVDIKKDGTANLFIDKDKKDDPYPLFIKNSGKTDIIDKKDATDDNKNTDINDFVALAIESTIITIILELIIVLIFAFIKKTSKRILLGVLIGNIISVPLLWVLVSHFYWTLFPAEIIVLVFEAWLIKYFSREKLGWKICLLLSLIMNLVSFMFGPILYNFLIPDSPTPIYQNREPQRNERLDDPNLLYASRSSFGLCSDKNGNTGGCYGEYYLYSSGKYVKESGMMTLNKGTIPSPTIIANFDKTYLEKIKKHINDSKIMNKNCPAQQINDASWDYQIQIDGVKKSFQNPPENCKSIFEKIDKILKEGELIFNK